jgi:hypothetical protein
MTDKRYSIKGDPAHVAPESPAPQLLAIPPAEPRNGLTERTKSSFVDGAHAHHGARGPPAVFMPLLYPAEPFGPPNLELRRNGGAPRYAKQVLQSAAWSRNLRITLETPKHSHIEH